MLRQCYGAQAISVVESGSYTYHSHGCLWSYSERRYAFEALLDNEFHGAEDFFFTPYAQKGIPKVRAPSARESPVSYMCFISYEEMDAAM